MSLFTVLAGLKTILFYQSSYAGNKFAMPFFHFSGLVTYFSYSIRHSKLNQKPYHPLPLDSVEEECVNLLADETQETSLDSGNL